MRVGFPLYFKAVIVAFVVLSADKEPFVQIMANIVDPQFGIHDNQPADFIADFKKLQGVAEQGIEILQLAVKMHIQAVDHRDGLRRQQIGLDTDLGITAPAGKYKRLLFLDGSTDIIRDIKEGKPCLQDVRTVNLAGNVADVPVRADDLFYFHRTILAHCRKEYTRRFSTNY